MSDFAYNNFNIELEKLDIQSLEGIFKKVQFLLNKKKCEQSEQQLNFEEIEKINNVYNKISEKDQLNTTQASMATMWEAVKNDSW